MIFSANVSKILMGLSLILSSVQMHAMKVAESKAPSAKDAQEADYVLWTYFPLANNTYTNKILLSSKDAKFSSHTRQDVRDPGLYRFEGPRSISIDFWDNGKENLLVIGRGLPDSRKTMHKFVGMFQDKYDILVLDYASTWCGCGVTQPIKTLFDDRVQDVSKVVGHIKNKKTYTQVIGLGLSYSAYLFVRAQADDATLFTKLILDSPYLASHRIFSHRRPTTSMQLHEHAVKNGYTSGLVNMGIYALDAVMLPGIALAWGVTKAFGEQPITEYLPKITIPVLHVYGFKDTQVSNADFWQIFESIGAQHKAYLRTPGLHGHNLSRVYGSVVNNFILNPDFFSMLGFKSEVHKKLLK